MDYMKRAIELAREALGRSSPNPPVGAVIVKDGRIVGEGSTMPRGQAHAEVIALRQAGQQAKGAVLYTTLEPCCHFGRTPPCTRDIIQAGIVEVHTALVDPNPLVNGMGLAELREAGVETRLEEEWEEAVEVAEAYVRFITTGLPFVIAKFAMSIDGKIASASGDSKWITSEEARCDARVLRGQVDAVAVGIETALSDDPRLTARDMDGNTVRETAPAHSDRQLCSHSAGFPAVSGARPGDGGRRQCHRGKQGWPVRRGRSSRSRTRRRWLR